MSTELDAYKEINDILKDKKERPESEELILTSATTALVYAISVLKKPWKKAEKIIATNVYTSLSYSDFIKGRFIEGEPTMLKHPIIKQLYLAKLKEYNDKENESGLGFTQL